MAFVQFTRFCRPTRGNAMFAVTLLPVILAAALSTAEVDPIVLKAHGRWNHPLVDPAVKLFLAHDTSAAERARLAADPALRPYLFLAVRRKAEDAPPKAVAALDLAFAARIRSRARRDQLPPHLDSLIELGVLAHADPKAFTPMYYKIHAVVDGLREHQLTREYFDKPKCQAFAELTNSVSRGELLSPKRFRTMAEYKQLLGTEFHRISRVGDYLDTSGCNFVYPMPGGLHLLRSGIKRKVVEFDLPDDYRTSLMLCGDTAHLGEVWNSIVIADGDIFVPCQNLQKSLFIATGEIQLYKTVLHGGVENSTFIAGDRIVSNMPLDCSTLTFAAGGKIAVAAKDEKKPGVRHEESKDAGLGLRFFKTEEVGVSFDPDLVRPVVKAVAADSPLRSVLKSGDELTQINGRKLANTGDARRALREAAALEFAFVARSRDNAAPSMALAHMPAPKAKSADKR